LNRLDEIVYYKPLTKAEIGSIVDLMTEALGKRLEDKQLTLSLTPAAKSFIIDNGYDPVYGARPLKRFIQHHLETLIARAIISDQLNPGDTIRVDSDGDRLIIA
ncbi:MAG: type VI secretion system ATPase TssH, partial [Ruminiclostridium sp.]|nr:type VI secretion system ATPase TssH [Ruminiclostridium sp.]